MTTPYHTLAIAVLSDTASEHAVSRHGPRALSSTPTAALDRVALPVYEPRVLPALWNAPVVLRAGDDDVRRMRRAA